LADVSDKSIQDILTPLCGLELPDIKHSKNYQKQSPFLRDNLPSAVGSDRTLDLRLLAGDLDDANAQTQPVKSILNILRGAEGISAVDPILLLSGSGFGKTKTIYDIAVERYTILLDAGSTNNDLSQMMTTIGTLKVLC
jgi:hypothetical protein